VVVAVILGVRLSLASAAARPVSVGSATVRASAPTTSTMSAGGRASPTGVAIAQPSPTATASSLVVYVSGRVRRAGVVRLSVGSRVQDALRAAGGALPGSDLDSINLAQPLTDGEQVSVARAGRGSRVSAAGASGPAGASGAPGGGPVVDLNSADTTALDALPGVGPVLAQRIVDWRTEHGRFSSVDELDEVSGIGDKLLSEIRPHVRI
jgi:competence protein ComEA